MSHAGEWTETALMCLLHFEPLAFFLLSLCIHFCSVSSCFPSCCREVSPPPLSCSEWCLCPGIVYFLGVISCSFLSIMPNAYFYIIIFEQNVISDSGYHISLFDRKLVIIYHVCCIELFHYFIPFFFFFHSRQLSFFFFSFFLLLLHRLHFPIFFSLFPFFPFPLFFP